MILPRRGEDQAGPLASAATGCYRQRMASLPDQIAAPGDGPFYPFGGAEPETGGVMEVAPGILWVRLKVPGPLRHVNCWLLMDGPDAVALVDTGMNRTETRDTWRAVFRGPMAGTRVSRVVGTHMHPDHIGLAGWMCDHHGAPVLMTRGEWLTAKLAHADARDEAPAEVAAHQRLAGWSDAEIARAGEGGWSRFRTIVTPLPHAYQRLRDGDRLPIGDREWRIVVGSGHSPEHACLLDEAGGVLVAGDQVLPRISSNISLGHSEPGADPLGEWFHSIEKLRGLPPGLLVLPGHGDPFTGLHARLDAMEAEHRQRLDTLQTLLAEPQRARDVFPALFARPIGPDVLGMATGEALAHLRRLEVEGRATVEDREGVRWWRAS